MEYSALHLQQNSFQLIRFRRTKFVIEAAKNELISGSNMRSEIEMLNSDSNCGFGM